MSQTNVVPVTQQELTKTEIEYSVKVGKQVIIEQINGELLKLRKEAKTLIEELTKGNETKAKRYTALLLEQLKLVVNNCSSANKIRLFVNTFTPSNFRSNMDIVTGDTTHRIAHDCGAPILRGYSLGGESSRNPQMCFAINNTFKKIIELGRADVEYTTCLSIPSKSSIQEMRDGEFEYNERSQENNIWETDIRIPDEILNEMIQQDIIVDRLKIIEAQHNELQEKLTNIHETMEKMEASLLVNELQRTDRGKEVLGIASGIISDILGNTPNLLLGNKSPN